MLFFVIASYNPNYYMNGPLHAKYRVSLCIQAGRLWRNCACMLVIDKSVWTKKQWNWSQGWAIMLQSVSYLLFCSPLFGTPPSKVLVLDDSLTKLALYEMKAPCHVIEYRVYWVKSVKYMCTYIVNQIVSYIASHSLNCILWNFVGFGLWADYYRGRFLI